MDFIPVNSFLCVCQGIHVYILHAFRFTDQKADLRTCIDKELQSFFITESQELKSKGMSMKTVNENATKDMLKEALRSDKDNIFIPTSGKNVMLIKILPQLILLVRDTPEQNIHLFGYPE